MQYLFKIIFQFFPQVKKKKTLIAYKKAKFVISNSSLVTKAIKKKFPNLRKKYST